MQIDRRKFGLLSLFGIAGAALRPYWLGGQSTATSAVPGQTPSSTGTTQNCTDLDLYENAVSWPNSSICFWVSGYSYAQTGMGSRSLLAVLLMQQQTTDSYIDKILLAAQDGTIVNVLYFSAQDKLSSGFLPYLIFDNVSFSETSYFLYIQQQVSGQTNRFRYTFVTSSQLQMSTMTNATLPATVRYALSRAPLNGVVSSPFFFSSSATISNYCLQAWLQTIDNNGSFQILIQYMHPDVSASNYSRYFIVTDPAGRILGITQRQYGQITSPAGFVTVTALTATEINTWGLITTDVGNINDCPYVMIFCDDVSNVILSATIWLR